jgi:hypothetical protein
MERLAKERLQKLQKDVNSPRPILIAGEPWPLFLAGKKLRQNFLSTKGNRISGMKASKYWEEKKQRFGTGYSEEATIKDVDTQATEGASIVDVDMQATEEAVKALPIAR